MIVLLVINWEISFISRLWLSGQYKPMTRRGSFSPNISSINVLGIFVSSFDAFRCFPTQIATPPFLFVPFSWNMLKSGIGHLCHSSPTSVQMISDASTLLISSRTSKLREFKPYTLYRTKVMGVECFFAVFLFSLLCASIS
jgi:hypothetical protein